MSIKMMTAVWDHSAAKGSELLLLLSIADNASDDGLAWPGIETLAQRTRLGKRAVIKLLDKAEKTGELRIHRRAGRHNHYILTVNTTPEQNEAALVTLSKRVDETVENLRSELFAPVNSRSQSGEPQGTSTSEPQGTRSIIRTISESSVCADMPPAVSGAAVKKSKPQRVKTEKPPQPHVALIDAWYDGMPTPPIQRKYSRNVAAAKRILDAGYTSQQVNALVRERYEAGYWQDKQMPLEKVEDDLPLWAKKHQPPAPVDLGDYGTDADQKRMALAVRDQLAARMAAGEFNDPEPLSQEAAA